MLRARALHSLHDEMRVPQCKEHFFLIGYVTSNNVGIMGRWAITGMLSRRRAASLDAVDSSGRGSEGGDTIATVCLLLSSAFDIYGSVTL